MIRSKLSSYDLKLLAVAIDSSDIYEHQLLQNMIYDTVGIDITDTAALNEQEVTNLKKFEQENTDLLVSIIISSKKRGLSYIVSFFFSRLSFNRVMGLMVFLFGCSYVGYVTVNTIPEDNIRFVDTVLGFVLGTMLSTVINFYFGSSTSPGTKSKKNEDNGGS